MPETTRYLHDPRDTIVFPELYALKNLLICVQRGDILVRASRDNPLHITQETRLVHFSEEPCSLEKRFLTGTGNCKLMIHIASHLYVYYW